MIENTFYMTDPEGVRIHVYEWLPDSAAPAGGDPRQAELQQSGGAAAAPIRGIVQIAHGMCETGARYARFAKALAEGGYAVYLGEHRGHGLTAGRLELLGDAGENGFYWMRRDMLQLAGIAAERHPGLPIYMFSHSMGSFLAQKMMCEEGAETYAGYVLCGSNGPRGMLALGETLAKALLRLQGDKHRSVIMNGLMFGRFNSAFSPVRTAFDWISRDTEEVDRFIADPYCGAICTTRFFRDFLGLLRDIHSTATLKQLCIDRPVLIISGDKDPVGLNGKGVLDLADMYRAQGVRDLECKLYPGARHELVNETNRGEVTADVLDWLDRHLPQEDRR